MIFDMNEEECGKLPFYEDLRQQVQPETLSLLFT